MWIHLKLSVKHTVAGRRAKCVEEGISTTDIVGRLLLLTQDHHTDVVAASEQGVFACPVAGCP